MQRRLSLSRFALLALFAVAACERPPESAFATHGSPESLIDVSSEVVNLSIANGDEIKQLGDWVSKDQPTRAELYCAAGDLSCADAQKVLDLRAVPSVVVPSDRRMVTLVYERILARDCNPRFTGAYPSAFGAHDAGYGCATAANIVQHVSNKQQFINPNISDNPSAVGAVLTLQRAYAPKTEVGAYGNGEEQTR